MVTAIRVLGCQRSYRAPWNPAFHSLTLTFILTLICPASRWTQWVTTQREQLTVLLPSSVPSSVGLSQSHCVLAAQRLGRRTFDQALLMYIIALIQNNQFPLPGVA